MKSIALMLVLLLSACDENISPESRWGADQCMRAEIFDRCMAHLRALSALAQADTINACDSVAYKQSLRGKAYIDLKCWMPQ